MNVLKCRICGGAMAALYRGLFDDRHGCPGRFDILKCAGCGSARTHPEPPVEAIAELYTRHYPRRSIDVEAAARSVVRPPGRIRRRLTGADSSAHYLARPGDRVLDVGCGDATSIRELAAMGADAHGVEPDENVRPLVEALGLKVRVGVFSAADYADDSFDLVSMSQVLEHVHDPAALLKSVGRILRPGGRVAVSVPNAESLLERKYGARWLNWHVPYHIDHFSRKGLMLLAEGAGYRVLSIRTVTPNLWVVLQRRMLEATAAEGERSPLFNPGEGLEGRRGFIERLGGLARLAVDTAKVPWLRAVDAVGMGESFLMVLERKG